MSRVPLLSVRNLTVDYATKKNDAYRAIDGIDLSIYPGETLGLVGESGCGKSSLAKTLTRIIKPTSGSIEYAGIDLLHPNRKEMQSLQKNLQLVFQNSSASLNPCMNITDIIEEPMVIHKTPNSHRQRMVEVQQLLDLVGLSSDLASRYPHELSGGQKQRVSIARALALYPKFIIFDESLSALDVSVQGQILRLLSRLQKQLNLTYLFISHDLTLVRYLSQRIAVMYQGKIIEVWDTEAICQSPREAYTQSLLKASQPRTSFTL